MLESKSLDEPVAVSRREQSKVDKRRRILAAAARLMAAPGLEATTADYCREARNFRYSAFRRRGQSQSTDQIARRGDGEAAPWVIGKQ